MLKQINRIKELLILGIIVIVPIMFTGVFPDAIGLPKLIILILLICVFLLLTALEIYFTGKFSYGKGKFDLAVTLFCVSYLVSAVLITPNKNEAFFNPGNATLVLGLGITYFFLNTIAKKNEIKLALIASAVIMSFIILGSFLGVFEKIPQLPSFVRSPLFNPTGDYITSSIFLVVTLPLVVIFLIKTKEVVKKLVFAFCLVFILIAGGISIFTLVSNKNAFPFLPDFVTSWAVAVDTVRESPVLGIGPGNYLTSFNRFRPVTYNMSNLWQIRFSAGRDWYLTVITETGIMGAIALGVLIYAVVKLVQDKAEAYKKNRRLDVNMLKLFLLVVLLLVAAVVPLAPATALLIFVFLALNSQAKLSSVTIGEGTSSAKIMVCLGIILAIGLLIVKARPIILAENKFKQANDALIANDGKATYSLLQDAINLNPTVDRYHASYAQVNLAIARSIISSKKNASELSDDDKNMITQLAQQAIREGQATVSLNPTRAANWQVLANIYEVLIPLAKQADGFAIEAYTQTINLDPTDPALRVALGGVYYSLGKYDDAINAFQFAILAKSDYANGYYNLAATYAAKSDFDSAIVAMNKVLSLVPKDSPDYKLAQSDLETLQKKQKTLEATSSGNLTAPQKATKAIEPTLNLPEGAAPPAGPKLPNQSPSPSSSPTASPTVAP